MKYYLCESLLNVNANKKNYFELYMINFILKAMYNNTLTKTY